MYKRLALHPPVLTRVLLLIIPLSLTAFGTVGTRTEGTLAAGETATPTAGHAAPKA